MDLLGNITRINNALEGMAKQLMQDREKPIERPSLKKKLELMKGKAAELSDEGKAPKQHMERGNCNSITQDLQ